jgi:hypothetical protein
MSDFTLADGREVTFDLDKLTYGQWLGIFSPNESEERTDKTLARVSGLELKDIKALKIMDFKRLLAALQRRVKEPLSDPNA